MYAKCGSIEDVQNVFDMMLKHNVVSWSTMIVGHMKCGQAPNALKLFQQMQHERVQPALVIFVGMLNACTSAGMFMNRLFTVALSLISLWVLSKLTCMPNAGSWRMCRKYSSKCQHAMLSVGMPCSEDFQCMDLLRKCLDILNWCEDGVEIDKVTFVALLSTCGHSGFVDEGLLYVESIGSVYNISATVEHYACMADLLGHAGSLHKAAE